MNRVDVIVPTRNGTELLQACVRALAESTYRDFRLIVFDDASTEEIHTVVAATVPDAQLLRSDVNVGLARGFNLAIESGTAEYVVLLNNDTEVEPSWLEELVACADRHPSAGSVASKLKLLSDRNRLHSAGDYFSVRGMPGNRGVWLEDVGQYDLEEPIFSACAGAALYRRAALDNIRLSNGQIFDERLFMYCEDVDLGWRLQRGDWHCVYAPKAVVYHALSATGGGALASYYVARNIWLVLARSVPRGVLAPYARRITVYHAGRIMRAMRHVREPAARATLRGTIVGLVLAASSRAPAPATPAHEIARLRNLMWHSPPVSMAGE